MTHTVRMLVRRRFNPLFMLNADGTGSGAGGDGTPNTEGVGGTPGTEAPTLTPEQIAAVNAEVARQLGAAVAPKIAAAEQKARSQWEADLKALADAENQTAEQKAQAAAEAARQEAAAAIEKANATLVKAAAQVAAVAAGANPARVDALLKLADLTGVTVTDGNPDAAGVKAAVDAALKDFPEFKAASAAAGGSSGGDLNGGTNTPPPKTLQEAVTKHYGQ